MLKSFITIIILISLFACTKKDEVKEEKTTLGKQYYGKGEVVSVHKEDSAFVVSHETIPGFMGAMTMGLRVKDPMLINNLQPADSINFTITVAGGEMYVTQIEKIE